MNGLSTKILMTFVDPKSNKDQVQHFRIYLFILKFAYKTISHVKLGQNMNATFWQSLFHQSAPEQPWPLLWKTSLHGVN